MISRQQNDSACAKAVLFAATILASGAAPAAFAQTTSAQTPPANAQTPATGSNEVSEVVVTGYRQSLAAATNAKRNAVIVQDSIFAEDIGKFPDTNLAESLNRVPGVQLARDINGEGVNVSIRGLGTNFTKILLNGNQIAVASTGATDSQNQNREVDLDMFPSELFSRLDVNKTPTADTLEGGVSGTVNMHTMRPFDGGGGRKLTYSLQGGYNSGSKQWSPRGALIGSDTWDTSFGRFGALVGLAGAENKYLVTGFETIGWTTPNLACAGCTDVGGNGFNFATTVPAGVTGNGLTPGQPITAATLQALNPGASLQQLTNAMIPRLGRQSYSAGVRDRGSLLTSFEYRPNDSLNFYLDGLFGRAHRSFNRLDMDWSVRNSNAMVPIGVQVDSNGVVTQGTFDNAQFFLEDRPYEENLDFFNINPGLSWQATDWFRVDAEYNQSKSTFLRRAPTVLINTPLGTGLNVTYTGGMPFPTIASNMDLNNPNLGWTWAGGRVQIQDEHRVTKTKAFHLDTTLGDDKANIKVGVAWDEASREILARDNSARWQQFTCAGGGTFQPAPAPQPACNGQAGSAVTQADLASYLEPGPGFVQVNVPKFFAATNWAQFDASAPFASGSNTGASSGIINEKTKGAYVEFNGATDIHEMPLKVNGGVRYVRTVQTITGPFTPPGAPGPTGFQTLGSHYDAFLPSFNAVLSPIESVNIRLSASRTLTRPNPSAMLPGTTFTDPSAQVANQGNPNLTPYMANNVDFGGEWYTGAEGYVGAVGFYKQISGFTVLGSNTVPFNQLGIPFNTLIATQQQAINNRGGPDAATVVVNQQVNASGVLTIRGYELNWVQPLSFLLKGLGYTANYTRVNQSSSGSGVPAVAVGVSKYTYNFTAYYDHGPASVRVSYTFQGPQTSSGLNQNGIPAAALFADSRGQWDAAASYTLKFLPSQPQLTLDAINIGNSVMRQYFEYPQAAFTYYKPGRTIILGIHGRF